MPHSYIPLFRTAARIFHEPEFSNLLHNICATGSPSSIDNPLNAVEAISLDWLRTGGKRLRPFVTLASYAVAMHGDSALIPQDEPDRLIPGSVKRVALAIEALHKASLIHDDIEDGDPYRYGRETVHRQHGLAQAINAGDYLVGLGYRLLTAGSAEIDTACTSDILTCLTSAHLELCKGQGAELAWRENRQNLKPADALAIYALKTAPAFEAALFAGLRLAGRMIEPRILKRFTTCVGEAYQIINDLKDRHTDASNKVESGRDIIDRRPTLLHAFAIEAGGGKRLNDALSLAADGGSADAVREVHRLYTSLGAFEKAETLLEKLKIRAQEIAGEVDDSPIRDLLLYLVRIVLRT